MDDFLEKLRNNDPASFRIVYETSYKVCAKYIMSNGGTTLDAEDIFQESLFVFLTKIKEKDFELTSKVSTYLYGICKNRWLYKLRNNKNTVVEKDLADNISSTSTEGLFSNEELLKSTDKLQLKALRILNSFEKKDCVSILKDFYFEQMSLTEIAEKQGYSLNYTKKKKANCLKYLKTAILNKSHHNGV